MRSISEERHDSVVVLVPSGDVDLTTLPAFEARMGGLIDEGVRYVLWDLGGVGLMPSAAIGFLLQAARRLHDVGGRMGLTGVGRMVRGTLSTIGVLDAFRVYETREEGIADLPA